MFFVYNSPPSSQAGRQSTGSGMTKERVTRVRPGSGLASSITHTCPTHRHARSSNAAASNSKLLNGFVQCETLLALLRFYEAALHRLRLQKVGRFPLGFDLAPQRDRHDRGSWLAALIGNVLDLSVGH